MLSRFVMVCQHTSCLRKGSAKLLLNFQLADLPPGVIVLGSGCQGQCHLSPIVRVLPEEVCYCRLEVSDVAQIVQEHLQGGKVVAKKLHPDWLSPDGVNPENED
jgi:(2Fe-2S) ferredoxin